MSAQSSIGLILILVGAIISLTGFFVISPVNDFLTAVLVTSLGFVLIAFGFIIIKARASKWINK